MRNIKTLVVAAGAAVVLGGIGVGVAQAASPDDSAKPAVSTSSTHLSHESEARGRVAEGETQARHEAEVRHEPEARGRVAEGETHARHTGTDDSGTHRAAEAGDDRGSDN
jgi:hypothetical protein